MTDGLEEGSPLGLTAEEAAAQLRISLAQLEGLRRAGRIDYEKVGRKYFYDRALKVRSISSPQPQGTPRPAASPPGRHSPADRGDPFAVLASLPEDHIIEIYRMKQGKRYYVVSMTPEEFSLKTISKCFGGGVYIAIGSLDGEIITQHGFAIDGPEKHPDFPQQEERETMGDTSAMMAIQMQVQQLASQMQAMQQALMAVAASQSQPREHGREQWLQEMMMMKQVFGNNQPVLSPEDSRKRWLEEIMLLKEVFGGQNGSGNNMETVSNALMKGIEMAASVSAIGEKESMGTALIKGMLPTISEVLGGIAKNVILPAAVDGGRQRNPEVGQLPASSVGKSSPTGEPEVNGNGKGLDMVLPLLKRAARENSDPYPYAALIAAEIPGDAVNYLKMATKEQFQSFVADLDPQLGEFPGWVGELREAILEELGNLSKQEQTE